MSQPQPRKARRPRQPANGIPTVSDHDSDASPSGAATSAAADAPPTRTNTELNLLVLWRYLPSIETILSIAANAVTYTFDSATQAWDKLDIEGTMFVCAQSPAVEAGVAQPRICVFIFNRKNMENLILELHKVEHIEVQGEFMIVQLAEETQEHKVLGIWIHKDEEDTREVNSNMILESWKAVRPEKEGVRVEETGQEVSEAGPALRPLGKRISLSELFGKKSAGLS